MSERNWLDRIGLGICWALFVCGVALGGGWHDYGAATFFIMVSVYGQLVLFPTPGGTK